MKITVHNPNNLPVVDYREVLPLQGDLKDLSDENYVKLRNSIVEHGFYLPLFIWKQADKYRLLDGHQRLRVLNKEQVTPYEIPYLVIEAETEQEAKVKLLTITSQYGKITYEGYDAFTADLPPELNLAQYVAYDALPLLGQDNFNPDDEDNQGKLDEKRKVTCPECGHEFTP